MKADEIEYKLERIEKIVKQIRDFCIVALIILTMLLFSGCSQTEAWYKDGVATVKRTRFLMTEDIDSFSYDASDGSFTLDGYKSDMTKALELIELLVKKDEVKP